MRSIVRNILVQGSLLLGLHTAAHAGAILVVTNGMLTGAQGVEFDGSQYDVAFSDTRPVAANLLFHSYEDAAGASGALDQLVFQGLYDTNPGRTNGCSSPVSCLVVTAFDIGWLGVSGAAFTNTSTRYIDPVIPYLVIGNAVNSAGLTYAHWSLRARQPDQQQAVPEPSTLLLAGAGLAALAWRRRARGTVA